MTDLIFGVSGPKSLSGWSFNGHPIERLTPEQATLCEHVLRNEPFLNWYMGNGNTIGLDLLYKYHPYLLP